MTTLFMGLQDRGLGLSPNNIGVLFTLFGGLAFLYQVCLVYYFVKRRLKLTFFVDVGTHRSLFSSGC